MAEIQRIDDELVEPFVSAYDAIFQEGVEKGIKQGFERGFEQGFRRGFEQGFKRGFAWILIRIAARHLPEPTPTQRERIEGASADQLEAWIDALLQEGPPKSWDLLLR